ncbi:MAG TPA: CocE/NonD family hydrolase [Gemmatimonadales bacterium]|jgi:hypothetical protein|nr:CocE/NonD family hydrolase [Gemmatimonadales bacterium]
MPRPNRLLLPLLLGLAAGSPGIAQSSRYQRRELTIPMRDGIRLFAVALIPQAATGPLPIILIRTPFGAAREFRSSELPPQYRELGEDGYIFVAGDIRGRFKSEGEFITTRAQNDPRNSPGTNESTDAYDTIDWLVKNLPGNNGKVGVVGISYRGWLAALAGVNPHPALKAISPQAPVTDTWLGDDFFHQGAFRQAQALAYVAWIESQKGLAIPDADQYDFYLRYPTLDSLARAMGVNDVGSWVGFRTHPAWDEYWQAMALQNVLTRPEVPILFVGGWWDQEDILGPELAYRTVEAADTGHANRIVLGPWYHGEWAGPGRDSLGPIALESNTAAYFREQIQRPWFAHYLHGTGDGRFPEAWAFETGGNRWRTFDAWPPGNARPRNIYLRENGKLAFDPPSAQGAEHDDFVSDPAQPVPYLPRPVTDEGWQTWLEQDQRFADQRADVLTWESDPLTEDLTIAGDVVAHLFASTTGTDGDWVVKLIDAFPDTLAGNSGMGGYQLMVNADIMRGRYWKGFNRATPIPADTVTPFTVDLHEQLYRFRKGHRLMVQIQSTWFPLYDRNPQTFVSNIFLAGPSDFKAQEHRIWHTRTYPSHIVLPVLDGGR